MYRIDYVSRIVEDADTLLEHERSLSEAKPRQRIQLLRLLKTGQAETMAEAALLVGLSKNHASVLWRQYQDHGISSLITTHYKGRIPRLNQEQAVLLHTECVNGFRSLLVSQEWIAEHLSLPYSLTGVWRLFGRLGIKKKLDGSSITSKT
jgi:transposase